MPAEGAAVKGRAVAVGSRYAAFISYSHSDDNVAEWLHRHLEHYRVPKGIAGGRADRRIGKVFRDRAELASSHDLGGDIRRALDRSDALILMCSPRAARSPYVEEEIRRFKETGKGERIFAVIIDGEPHAAGKPGRSAVEECFPRGLLYQVGADGAFSETPELQEPIAADFRDGRDGRQNGALKIIAGLLNLGLDDLVQREKRAERARRLRANAIAIGMGVLALGALTGGVIAWWQQGLAEAASAEAVTQSNEAKRQRLEAELRKGEAEAQKIEAEKQTASALERLSNNIARESRAMFEGESADHTRSLLMALYADPAARSSSIPAGLAPEAGYDLARARLIAPYEHNRLEGVLTTGLGMSTDYESVISAVAYSPDNRLLVTGSAKGAVRVWDLATQKLLRTLPRRSQAIRSISFTRDGKRLLVSAYDGVPQLWNTATWRQGLRLAGTEEGGEAAISADGSRVVGVVGVSDRYDFRIWDAQSGEALRTIEGGKLPVHQVVFSHDGGRFAAVSNEKVVRVWDVATGEEVWSTETEPTMYAVAFSPDGKSLAAGDGSGALHIWALEGEEPEVQLEGNAGTIDMIAFDADGKTLLAVSSGGAIRTWKRGYQSWDADDGSALQEFKATDQFLASTALSLDGRHIAMGYYDGATRLWNVAPASAISTLALPLEKYESVEQAAFSPDGRTLAFVSGEVARLWDVASRKVSFTLKAELGYRPSVTFSFDGQRLALVSLDQPVRVFDVANGKLILELRAVEGDRVNAAVFSPDGRWIATAAEGGVARIWNARTGKPVHKIFFDRETSVFSVAFSQDSRTLAVGARTLEVGLWDVATGKPVRKLYGHEGTVTNVIYSVDGRYLLTGSSDGTLRIWDAQSGEAVRRLQGHNDMIYDAQFSRDGRFVVSTSMDRTVKLWDARTGNVLATMFLGSARPASVSFSADQRYVAIAGDMEDGVLLWALPAIAAAPVSDQVKGACTMLWNSNAPLAFKRTEIAIYGVLEGQPTEPDHPKILASPCRGVLADEAFDPATAQDAWMRVYHDGAKAAPTAAKP